MQWPFSSQSQTCKNPIHCNSYKEAIDKVVSPDITVPVSCQTRCLEQRAERFITYIRSGAVKNSDGWVALILGSTNVCNELQETARDPCRTILAWSLSLDHPRPQSIVAADNWYTCIVRFPHILGYIIQYLIPLSFIRDQSSLGCNILRQSMPTCIFDQSAVHCADLEIIFCANW